MQRRIFAPALFLALLLSCFSFAENRPRPDGVIRVEIAGLRNDKGQVLCALFSSPSDFPKKMDKAIAHATSGIANKHAVCEFRAVASGTYAISVVHDENSNGKLDTSFLGIPREGVGASNDAKGHFGPPKFDAAAFRAEHHNHLFVRCKEGHCAVLRPKQAPDFEQLGFPRHPQPALLI
jgi:uncharacterized protein (DUF2141 family)